MSDSAPTPAPKPLAPWLVFVSGSVAMAALIAAGAWWVLHPKAPTPEPIVISVDANTTPHVGRIILLHADTKGGLVKWRTLTAPIDQTKFDLKVQPNSHDAELVTPQSGPYRIEAATAIGNEADVQEITVPVDTWPVPPIPPVPPVPPVPPPGPIPAGALRLLMSYDPQTNVTQGQLDVLKSAASQKIVPSGNWRVFATNQTFGDEAQIWKDVFAKRKNPIGIVIFNGNDGSIAYEGSLPNSVADVVALVKKYSGP